MHDVDAFFCAKFADKYPSDSEDTRSPSLLERVGGEAEQRMLEMQLKFTSLGSPIDLVTLSPKHIQQ